jgi:hypothetical protein
MAETRYCQYPNCARRCPRRTKELSTGHFCWVHAREYDRWRYDHKDSFRRLSVFRFLQYLERGDIVTLVSPTKGEIRIGSKNVKVIEKLLQQGYQNTARE